MARVGGSEWNDAKATANLRKHGVSFEQAAEACDDALALVLADPVVTIEKAESTRIISARRAAPAERRAYEQG